MKNFPSSMLYLISLTLVMNSSADKAVFNRSLVVPAARGEVKVKTAKSGNYLVEVKLNYLASPDKLSPPKDYYVVWVKSKKEVHNIGVLSVSESLEGYLLAETPHEVKRVIITAEKRREAEKLKRPYILKSKRL